MPYYGGVCQGDTNSASDCKAAYDALAAVYGASNVAGHGFDVDSGAKHANSAIAGPDEYRGARVCNVLYWSSHGGHPDGTSQPALNLTVSSKKVSSGLDAMNYWPQSPQRLNVVIFAACYQFNGAKYCTAWANNVMRRTDIRALCGYHAKGPVEEDTAIAKKFFSLCKAGSTGNSVMYSWRHANIDNDQTSKYTVLVYNDDNRCYYRLPGFSSKTYPDPNRSTTKIYRYYGTNSSAAAPMPTAAKLAASFGSMPYELEIVRKPCLVNEKKIGLATKVAVDSALTPTYYIMRENVRNAISSMRAQNTNQEYIQYLLGDEILEKATLESFDDAMSEVLIEGGFGPETIIGAGTRVVQKYNGVGLDRNCLVISSDASGIYSVMNQWLDVTPIKSTAHIDLANNDVKYIQGKIQKAAPASSAEKESTMVTAKPVYKLTGNKFVLHYEVKYANGTSEFIDAKAIAE